MENLKLSKDEELKDQVDRHKEHIKSLKSQMDENTIRINMLVRDNNKQKHTIIMLQAEIEGRKK